MRYIRGLLGSYNLGRLGTMKNINSYATWAAIVLAALLLSACSSTDTRVTSTTAPSEASAAEEEAQKRAAIRQAEREAQVAAQKQLEETASDVGRVFYFDFDSSAMTDETLAQVDAHIAALMGNNRSVRLNGHTDERGTREYNLALGERRANAVRDYMVANGVPSYRIETISYGEENPVAYGSGERNWRQNRRVELK